VRAARRGGFQPIFGLVDVPSSDPPGRADQTACRSLIEQVRTGDSIGWDSVARKEIEMRRTLRSLVAAAFLTALAVAPVATASDGSQGVRARLPWDSHAVATYGHHEGG
jgi:hypothetical protein